MSKFKVGDNIIKVVGRIGAPKGFKSIVEPCGMYKDEHERVRPIFYSQWELDIPKWTIYNNTLPWLSLSNKQKGKILLAHNEGLQIKKVNMKYDTRLFKNRDAVYQVINTVKPEPTMAELFKGDWYDCLANGGNKYEQMIAKGWVKK
tara:strand:+ start:213 stop:653 length:441 start_codon:yes stop_codon:yes gene_type:complete